MDIIDFFIGLTLVNALPHWVLGIWKGRMFSGLGFGNRANIGYAIINFGISLGLFLYKYGVSGISEQGMFVGGAFVGVMYFILGSWLYRKLHVAYWAKRNSSAA
ncbi:MAG TPA: hypothetical protein DCE41_23220 [Cytophagales bacterium]|nr:hypothetical protein [Cytophagales bacterium]HAA21768.1 hypothetical protein [Cytophagales bacterium]HAP60072.1 hypothetical protein [Cytophagales bacterium]